MISILNGPFVNKKWISKSWKQGHSILPHQKVGMADSCTFSSARPLEVASGKGHGHRHWATSAVQRKTAALMNLSNQEGRAETGVSLAAKRKKHIMTALLNFFLFLKKISKIKNKSVKSQNNFFKGCHTTVFGPYPKYVKNYYCKTQVAQILMDFKENTLVD